MSRTLITAMLLLALVLVFCAAAATVARRWHGEATPSLLARVGASIRGGARYGLLVRTPGTSAYLAKIAILSVLVSACLTAPTAGRAFATAAAELARLPQFELQNGVFHADVPQPFVRRTPDFEFIIDTTGGTGPAALAARPTGVLITAHRAYLKKNASQTTVYDFSQLSGMTIDRRTVQRLALTAMRWGIPLAAVLAGAVMVGLAFWRALVLAALLLVFSRISRRRHDWQATWGVAAHAWTLPLALGPFHALLHIDGLVYWAGAVVYAVIGLHAVEPPPSDPGSTAPPTPDTPPDR